MSKKIGKVLIYLVFIAAIVGSVVFILKAGRTPDPEIMDIIGFFEDGKIVECEYNKYLSGGTVFVKTADGKEYSVDGITEDFFMDKIFDRYIDGKADAVVPETEGTPTEVPGTGAVTPPQTSDKVSGIKFKFTVPATTPAWVTYVGMFLVIAVVIGLVIYMMKQNAKGGGGGGVGGRSFGKIRAKNALDIKNKVYFKDVAGCDEEKGELQEIVEYLRNPEKFTKLGAKIPRGVLLVGPPGTGKTLLSKAVAGEAGVPFYSISGSDFVELYVGVGASRVRDLFETARKHPASIIFIDEIDAVGRHRGAGLGGGHDEREQTLNQLLVEMDGFTGAEGTIVMAATNRPDILDPALLRPGRFDRQVTVNYPDMKGREEILKVHARKKPLEETVDLHKIAQITVGMTGADLANVLNEAALLAARKGKNLIGMNDIEEATMKVVVGTPKKSYKISEKDKKNTAVHEAGHALLDYYLPTQNPVRQISIIPSSKGALGYTLSPDTEDKFSEYKTELEERIAVLLGGRVAETVVFGDYCGGASSDISRATSIAKTMVTKIGMSELGPIRFGSGHSESEVFLGRDFSNSRDYSEDTAAKIDAEIKKIIDKSYKLAEDTIRAHIDKLNFVADYLVEYEVMDADQFRAAMESPAPNAAEIYALADAKRKISEEENKRKKEIDEKERLEREKYLRENDENYDETDVNRGRYNKEEKDSSDNSDGEVSH